MPRISIEKLKEHIKLTTSIIKALDSELLAYRTVFFFLKAHQPEQGESLDELRKEALTSPYIAERMHEKYDVPLEKWLASVDEAALEEVLSQLIREWKPEGPIH